MHFISVLAFAFSVNIDNFIVGVAYGIKKIKIGFLSNLLIAFITAAGTLISMEIGVVASQFLSPKIANAFGSILLILIGIWATKDFFRKKKPLQPTNSPNCSQLLKEPEKADNDHSGTIDLKESITLGLALSINNFGLGIGASITHIDITAAVACTFFSSIIFFSLGRIIGKSYLYTFFGKYASLFSGILIILLGLYELLI